MSLYAKSHRGVLSTEAFAGKYYVKTLLFLKVPQSSQGSTCYGVQDLGIFKLFINILHK